MPASVGTEWWRPSSAVRADRAGLAAGPPSDSAVPFAALLVVTFVLLLSPQTFLPVLGRLRIALLAGGVAIAAYCWDRFRRQQPFAPMTRELWTAAALLCWAVVTLPLSEWPGGSLQILVDLFLKALIVFWLFRVTLTSLKRLRVVAWSLSLMAVPLAFTFVRTFAADPTASRVFGQYGAGLTWNPNDLALTLNLILPLTVALFLVSRRQVARGLLAGLIALEVCAIVVSFSRGGFLTLATVLILYLRTLHKRGQWKWVIAALVVAVAAVPLLPAGYLARLGTITNIEADQTGSAQARVGDTRAALAFVASHPLVGAGMGMNILALNDLRGARWLRVHNAYLEYAMDLGWPGLGLFLVLLTGCIRTAARLRDRCAGVPELRDLFTLADAIRISLVGFAVAALFHPVAYTFYFFLVAGPAVALPSVFAAETRHLLVGADPVNGGYGGRNFGHGRTSRRPEPDLAIARRDNDELH
jgi:probable O-glycosylation ligase (exosortase A-associated)